MMRHGVRWKHLGWALLGGGLVGWGLLRVVLTSGGSIPRLPWLGVAVMVLIAALLVAAGVEMRRYLTGKHTRRPSPTRSTATLAAAQAGAVTGALLTGWYGVGALVAMSLPDTPGTRDHLLRYAVHAGAAVLVTVAGMVTQWCCQLPPPDGDDAAKASKGDPGPAPA